MVFLSPKNYSFAQISVIEKNKILKISHAAKKISGRKNPNLNTIVDRATKTQAIVKNPELFNEMQESQIL